MTSPDFGIVARDSRSAPFFDAAGEERLVVRRCDRCAHVFGPELHTCSACASEDASWIDAAGRGSLISWVAVHRKGRGDAPPSRTVVGTVELDEGPWLTFAVDTDEAGEAALRAGAPMQIGFVGPDGGDGEPLPVWRTA